ncbi:hypothetical protein IWW36_000184 [Coemansia brasiliensis]|uniref:LIM zinc-binding domain-containing protein n=1 Tax=Coemansia brasiliensis TaxID=2650707 RepID=A0A9W8IE20_9FUNG|nr:hypothetical protein IWW36_000184 [Coemansia brasiliensis]
MYEREREIFCRTCFNRGPNMAPPPVNSTESWSEHRHMETHSEQSYQNTSFQQTERISPRQIGGGASPYARPLPQTPPRASYAVPSSSRSVGISPSSVFSSGKRNFNLPANKDICPRCSKPIYHAEKVVGPGGPWHRACFKCKECNTTLDSSKITEHNGDAYCRTCYGKLFTPTGYGIARTTDSYPLQPPRSPSDRSEGSARAPSSLAATPVHRQSSPSPARWAEDPAHNPFGSAVGAAASAAVQGHAKSPTSSPFGATVSRPSSSRTRLSYGRPYTPVTPFGLGSPPADICPRCSGRIYAAEQGMAAGRKYHKSCIKCKSCNTSLNSLKLTERNGEIYCNQCYSKHFGVHRKI